MRDFLKFLRSPKPSLPLLVFAIALFALGVIILRLHLGWNQLSAEYLSFERSKEVPELYVASPLEAYLLDTYEEMWPETFHPSNPLKSVRLPELYTRFRNLGRWELFSPQELDSARQLSILLASGHHDELKRRLIQPKSASLVRDEKECSVLMQDTLFRVTQVWPQYEADFRSYMERCAPHQIHALWFELQNALEKQNAEALNLVALKFQQGMNEYPGKWSRHFALEAYQLAHMMAVRIREKDLKDF
jgi:hypothetical protein